MGTYGVNQELVCALSSGDSADDLGDQAAQTMPDCKLWTILTVIRIGEASPQMYTDLRRHCDH